MTTRTVTATYKDPAGTPATGRVTFELATVTTDGTAHYVDAPVSVLLDGLGNLAITLTTTDTYTTDVAYHVTEHLNGCPARDYWIKLPAGAGSVNLATLQTWTDQPGQVFTTPGAAALAALGAFTADPLALGCAVNTLPAAVGSAGTLNTNRVTYSRLLGTQLAARTVTLYVVTQTGNIAAAIYADNNGTPGNRLASSGSLPCPAPGLASITLDAPVDILHGKHWLGFAADNNTASFINAGGHGSTQASPFPNWTRYEAAYPCPAVPNPVASLGYARTPAAQLNP